MVMTKMSRSFSEQELFARFEQLNQEIPPEMAARIERKVLAEVAVTLRHKEGEAVSNAGWFAQLLDRIPKLQLAPSFAMAGAVAAMVIVVLMFNADIRNRLLDIIDGPGPNTGAPGSEETIATATADAAATATAVAEETATAEAEVAALINATATNEAALTATAESLVPPTDTPAPTVEPTATPSPSLTTEAELSSLNPSSAEQEATDVGTAADEIRSETTDTTSDQTEPAPPSSAGENNLGNPPPSGGTSSGNQSLASPTPTVLSPLPTATPTLSAIVQAATPTATERNGAAGSQFVPTPTNTPLATNTPSSGVAGGDSPEVNIPTSTSTPTHTNTPRPTASPTNKPTASPTRRPPTETATPVPTSTPATSGGSTGGAPIAVNTNTPVPTETDTSTPLPTATDTDTPVPTETDTSTPLPTATDTDTPVPTATDTDTPVPSATPTINQPPIAEDYTVEAIEDGILTFNLRNQITNPDNDSISIQIIKWPEHGTLTQDDDFMAKYAPNTNFVGQDTILLKVMDSGGLYDEATVTIQVRPSNDDPNAGLDRVQVDEDGSILIDVLKNDTDPDGDPLNLVNVGVAQHGTTRIENGQVRYVPHANFFGQDAFTYQFSDGTVTVAAGVEVLVRPVQDPPQPQPESVNVDEDTSIQIAAVNNDVDVDGDDLQIVKVDETSAGTVQITADRKSIIFTPVANSNGSVVLTYRVSDGSTVVPGVVTINVKPVPDAPVAVDVVKATNEDAPVQLNPVENDTDVDAGDTLTLSRLVSNPQNGTATIGPNNTIVYTPRPNFNGSDSFEYEVRDSSGLTDIGLITINVTDFNAPPVTAADEIETAEDAPALIPVLANDTDQDQDAIEIQSFTQPSNGLVEKVNGTLRYTPNPHFHGIDEFTYTATDGKASATATVKVTVRSVPDVPVLENDVITGPEDTLIRIPVLQNDRDADGERLSVISVSQPTNGTVTIENGQVLLYQPNPNFAGTDNFTYIASDGTPGHEQQANVQVTVEDVNDPPQGRDDEVTLNEDGSRVIDVLENDTDADGDQLSISAIVQPPAHGELTIVENGSKVRYVPDPNFAGEDEASILITDGSTEVVTRLSITVRPVVDKPDADDDEVTGREDTLLTIDVLANDRNPDTGEMGSAAGLKIVGNSAPSPGGSLKISDTVLSLEPPKNFSGELNFEYTVCYVDNCSDDLRDTARVTVVIDPVNDPPKATDDEEVRDASADFEVPFDVLWNDTDVDTPKDQLTVTIQVPDQGGAVVQDNQIVYTPMPGFAGEVVIRYTVWDGPPKHSLSDEGTLKITINPPPNRAPHAVDDAKTTNEEVPVDVPVAEILGNDSDPDGDPLSIQSVGTPANGSATLVDNVVRYVPNADFSGTDEIVYEVSDGQLTSQAKVRITVIEVVPPEPTEPPDQPPAPQDDTATTNADQHVIINVLENDGDPNGDPLSLVSVGTAANGTAELNGAQKIRYTPNPGFSGTDSFTYTVAAKGLQGQANVVVTVNAVPQGSGGQPPIAETEPVTNTAEAPVVTTVEPENEPTDDPALTRVTVITPTVISSGTTTLETDPVVGGLGMTTTITVVVGGPDESGE